MQPVNTAPRAKRKVESGSGKANTENLETEVSQKTCSKNSL